MQADSQDGKVVYTARRDGTQGVTCVRTRDSVPPDCAVYMFEVTVLEASLYPARSQIGASLA